MLTAISLQISSVKKTFPEFRLYFKHGWKYRLVDSTGNDSFSTHKFHLMVKMAKILVHPYEK